MQRTMIVMVGIALLSGAGAAISRNNAEKAPAFPAAVESKAGNVSRGTKAWVENCGACHNVRSPADLSDAQWSVATTHMRVRANLSGDMARDIIAFLQASNGGETTLAPAAPASAALAAAPTSTSAAASTSAVGDPVKGGRIYGETCVACHGQDGKGALAGMPDFRAANGRLSKPDAVLLRNIINGFQTPGSPMPMPARGGNPDLTDQDLADVLAYMRTSFGRK